MQKEQAIEEAAVLADTANVVMVGTIGDEGYPNIKAMFKMENKSLKEVWFSTNTSSKRVSQIKTNSKTCVYFADTEQIKGLMLVGNMEVLHDVESKRRFWRVGFERYYPQGVNDPDYCILHFTSNWGNYYHALTNFTFEL